ncbi:class I histocompatibility antigen, F10 alpha chain-like [Megalops cyprinoides]|uniref:class I histocompatibility antigen, F10 alpha chain-like n=1 Tax=Megalops cyprinoides TaxID=118141 RepID=UPI0018641B18|nr:class I histocompatibility antigen, F10 alpha chain-like [Megalops cyprinoides]
MIEMERMIVLLILCHISATFAVLQLSLYGAAAIHSLQYLCTATLGISAFPEFVAVGMVDEEDFSYYDSNIRREIPRQEWAKEKVEPEYWEKNTKHFNLEEQSFKEEMENAMHRFNQTGGVHTLQSMNGCEWDDENDKIEGFFKHGYDGEDYLTFYLKNIRFPQTATAITSQSDNESKLIDCTRWLKRFVQYGRSTLERKVPPEVTLLQKDPSCPVTCHVTGFYPRPVNVSWQRDGEDLHEDVELGETLPNGDGTFQIRSSLRVSPEDRRIHKYTCTVQHSSLKENIVKELNEGEIFI